VVAEPLPVGPPRPRSPRRRSFGEDDQLGGWYAERSCEAMHVQQARITFSALDPAHVRSMQSTSFSELLLRPGAALPSFAYGCAERDQLAPLFPSHENRCLGRCIRSCYSR